MKRGWIRRIDVDDDGRGVTLEITPDGRRALDGAAATANTRLDVVLSNVDGTERAQAYAGLAVLGHALELHLTGERPAPRAGAHG